MEFDETPKPERLKLVKSLLADLEGAILVENMEESAEEYEIYEVFIPFDSRDDPDGRFVQSTIESVRNRLCLLEADFTNPGNPLLITMSLEDLDDEIQGSIVEIAQELTYGLDVDDITLFGFKFALLNSGQVHLFYDKKSLN